MKKNELSALFLQQIQNPSFCKQLQEKPHETLKSLGIQADDGTQIKVVQNTSEIINMIVPAFDNTSGNSYSDDDLEAISAGELVVAIGAVVTFTALTAIAAIGVGVWQGV